MNREGGRRAPTTQCLKIQIQNKKNKKGTTMSRFYFIFFYLYACEICKVDTFGHPLIVHSASKSWIRLKRSDSLEYRNVCAMRAGIFIVQKFASIFLTQLYSSVKRLVLKCFNCLGADFLVRLVKRIGLVHVFFAVKMSIL
jgi:hypothetical protein